MISQETANDVIWTVLEWAKARGINNIGEVRTLFLLMSKVKGNKSFSDSMKRILEQMKEF